MTPRRPDSLREEDSRAENFRTEDARGAGARAKGSGEKDFGMKDSESKDPGVKGFGADGIRPEAIRAAGSGAKGSGSAGSEAANSRPAGSRTAAETGAVGERAAAAMLRRRGFELRHLNWRAGRYELDIVARRGDELHFVEVKTRRAEGLAPPEAALTPRKRRALQRAAEAYVAEAGWRGEVRFDLAAVEIGADGATAVRLVADALEYNWS